MIRAQLPVYSPVSGRAVLGGMKAMAGGAREDEARRRVHRELDERLHPVDFVLTDSGTTALTMALRAVSRERAGAPVALPAYCCYDVATAASGADVPVLLYDLDPTTLGPDLESLRATFRQGAGCVVIAHLYGIPVDLDPIAELSREASAVVIEDAAQAAGARYAGGGLGSFGSLAVMSFGRGKGTTGGGGGALLANDAGGGALLQDARAELPECRPRGWSELAALAAQWALGRPGLYALPASIPWLDLGETVYQPPAPLRRISAFSIGTLARTLEADAAERETRLAHARELLNALGPEAGVSPVSPPSRARPGFLRLPVLASECAAVRFREPTSRSLGVMPGYPQTLDRLQQFRSRCRNRAAHRPGAMTLAERLFTLPTHSRLSTADLSRLCRLLSDLNDTGSGEAGPSRMALSSARRSRDATHSSPTSSGVLE